ncbi:hypothetical protein ATK74_0798 [Propionicimonas paludicola]|uniref:HicA-like toxin of HicAB toxin-antitoxin system n=1 Tax=Propionicimonas paludicola TaxID=185243 RepID=A0A2A9CPB2_9ACTN|nr:hypothetical protein [Propionicimonas paludicola]PFG16264.1 hypothetical protein ATK74_0798 [Propionicimonas paludicola]
MITLDKDLAKILRAAEKQGFEVRHTSDGHPMVYRNGQFVTKTAMTPSDRRGSKNLIAALRRFGFEWPPKR